MLNFFMVMFPFEGIRATARKRSHARNLSPRRTRSARRKTSLFFGFSSRPSRASRLNRRDRSVLRSAAGAGQAAIPDCREVARIDGLAALQAALGALQRELH